MSVFPKKIAISLTFAALLGAFAASPSLAGVITPADKETIAAETPLEFVGWRRMCHWHCHMVWRPCHRPVYSGCYHRHYCDGPVYVVTYPGGWGGGYGWGGGWGGGLLGLGVFGLL